MKTAALYVRVSTEMQTTDNQLILLKEHCNKNNITIYKVYEDIVSGSKGDRISLRLMLEDAKAKMFDTVIFYSLDRLSREGAYKTFEYLQTLDKANVNWISLTEDWLNGTGPFKSVIISLLATLAKIEREKISERTKVGLRRTKESGTILGAKRIIDVTKVQELRKADLSNRAIARILNVSSTAIDYIVRDIKKGRFSIKE